MRKCLVLIICLALAGSALAHRASSFVKGPNGGHIVDAGGGAQHFELVASGSELTLYVTDKDEKPIPTAGGGATAQVLVSGKTHRVTLTPAGGNILRGKGGFTAAKGMRVIVKTSKIGGKSYQVRMTPLN